jgi:hypothetical protein
MIREVDIKQISEIKDILKVKLLVTHNEKHKQELSNKIDLLDRMVENLKIAPFCYRNASADDKKHNYYTAKCDKCDWWGSSKYLLGGGQIADTGDYDDCFCPVCGNSDIDEK